MYSQNMLTSKEINGRTQAQLQTTMDKLANQWKQYQAQIQKQKEEESKQHTMGILNLVMGIIAIVVASVFLFFLAGVMGPFSIIAETFMVAMIASSITQMTTGTSAMQYAFQGLTDLMNMILGGMGIHGTAQEVIEMVVKVVLVVIVCVAVIASNPVMFLFGALSSVLILTDSGN